jgi:hypothetical protein
MALSCSWPFFADTAIFTLCATVVDQDIDDTLHAELRANLVHYSLRTKAGKEMKTSLPKSDHDDLHNAVRQSSRNRTVSQERPGCKCSFRSFSIFLRWRPRGQRGARRRPVIAL